MQRKFTEKKLLIASNNPGKVKEISSLLSPFGIEVISATDFNIKEPEETGVTFAQNALLKAQYYGKLTSLPALSDDSGLCIEALDGFPGVYSARFAGEDRNFTNAFKLIEEKLQAKNLNTSPAAFICSLALWWPNGQLVEVEGKVTGNISFPPRGKKGFGYDPIFIADGYNQSFAEMDAAEKNKISHRAMALKQLINICF